MASYVNICVAKVTSRADKHYQSRVITHKPDSVILIFVQICSKP